MNGPRLQAPIVLVHGILGFSELRLGGVKIGDYFRGIRDGLLAAGNVVPVPPQLSPAGSVKERAIDLKEYLDNNSEIAEKKIHLIAHSMGGLDSRYMISSLGMADRVLTLTTIGTPHRGTPVADQGIDAFRPLIENLLRLGVDIRGFFNLTTAECEKFNNENLDANNLRYFSIAGDFVPKPANPLEFFAGDLLKPSYDIIQETLKEPNDGLVPLSSARYGNFLGTWQADHFRLVNWATNLLTPVEELEETTILENYFDLVQRLSDEGF